jgi:hypothetical protein
MPTPHHSDQVGPRLAGEAGDQPIPGAEERRDEDLRD